MTTPDKSQILIDYLQGDSLLAKEVRSQSLNTNQSLENIAEKVLEIVNNESKDELPYALSNLLLGLYPWPSTFYPRDPYEIDKVELAEELLPALEVDIDTFFPPFLLPPVLHPAIINNKLMCTYY